mmetsp:Transcript_50054/g.76107  ORF Transcript_50054/g.76107 Transcript_50054/m.76107 type:complete len:495 (-) Transcript_50054:144-1628(-)
MIPQRPRGRLIYPEEAVGCIPNLDNLSHDPSDPSVSPRKATSQHETKAEDFDMYEDAEETANGQFEDATGDSVILNCVAQNDTEEVPYSTPFQVPQASISPPAKKMKTALSAVSANSAATATAPITATAPRKFPPLPLNPFRTNEKKSNTWNPNEPQSHANEKASNFLCPPVAPNNKKGNRRAPSLNSLSIAAKAVEANDKRYDGNQLCCNDVILRRGAKARRHPGNVFFQSLIIVKRKEYLRARPDKKAELASFLVSIVGRLKPKGNFFKKSKQGNWVEASASTAIEVTHQLFRNEFTLADKARIVKTRDAKTDNQTKGATESKREKPQNRTMPPPNQALDNQRILNLQAAAAAEQARTAAVMANFPMGMSGVFPGMNPFAVFVPPYPMGGNLPMSQYETARAAYFGGSMGALAASNMQATQFYMAQQQVAMATDGIRPMQNTSQTSVDHGDETKAMCGAIQGGGEDSCFQDSVEKSEDTKASTSAPETISSS